MIKAVLLDLDNTLLLNPDFAFATAFLQRLQTYFQERFNFAEAGTVFRQIIPALASYRDGSEGNQDLILRFFQQAIQAPQADLRSALNDFYATTYTELSSCIQPIAGANELIQRLRSEDYSVIIATNPLYPESAIKQRMAWAGLPIEEGTYGLITSTEVMHFSKPNPTYYAEILGRVGLEPDEAIMVGDSQHNDISPAQAVGIYTYSTQEGSLQNFSENFASIFKNLAPLQLSPSMIQPQLRGNIGALYGMLENVQPNFWHQRPDPNEWSIVQILCHLVTAECSTERPRLERILNETNPFLTSPKPPGPNIPVCAEDGYTVASDFKSERQKTIDFLANLQAEDWLRTARHSIFGLTNFLEMAYFTAQHDRLHLKQLCQTIGRCE